MGLHPRLTLPSLALFAGGAGLELGIARALRRVGRDHRTVCYVEREAYAAAVLAARMEEGRLDPAPVWSDVSTFDGRPWHGRVDLVSGGFPCTDISNAGKRAGIDGEASGLWREYARIVREVRPSLVFVENVSALLVRGIERVLGDLAALGFDAEWCVLRASDVGAPHQRARLFILARAVSDAERDGLRFESERDQRSRGRGRAAERGHAEPELVGEGLAHAVEPGLERRECGGVDADGRREPEASRAGGIVADADGGRLEGERRGGLLDVERSSRGHDADRSRGRAPWPPGPDDRGGWIRYLARWPGLEPAIRRGADGMASGLDMRVFGPRVDQLRMLGNGVVPDQAEAAFLILGARLGLWEGE